MTSSNSFTVNSPSDRCLYTTPTPNLTENANQCKIFPQVKSSPATSSYSPSAMTWSVKQHHKDKPFFSIPQNCRDRPHVTNARSSFTSATTTQPTRFSSCITVDTKNVALAPFSEPCREAPRLISALPSTDTPVGVVPDNSSLKNALERCSMVYHHNIDSQLCIDAEGSDFVPSCNKTYCRNNASQAHPLAGTNVLQEPRVPPRGLSASRSSTLPLSSTEILDKKGIQRVKSCSPSPSRPIKMSRIDSGSSNTFKDYGCSNGPPWELVVPITKPVLSRRPEKSYMTRSAVEKHTPLSSHECFSSPPSSSTRCSSVSYKRSAETGYPSRALQIREALSYTGFLCTPLSKRNANWNDSDRRDCTKRALIGHGTVTSCNLLVTPSESSIELSNNHTFCRKEKICNYQKNAPQNVTVMNDAAQEQEAVCFAASKKARSDITTQYEPPPFQGIPTKLNAVAAGKARKSFTAEVDCTSIPKESDAEGFTSPVYSPSAISKNESEQRDFRHKKSFVSDSAALCTLADSSSSDEGTPAVAFRSDSNYKPRPLVDNRVVRSAFACRNYKRWPLQEYCPSANKSSKKRNCCAEGDAAANYREGQSGASGSIERGCNCLSQQCVFASGSKIFSQPPNKNLTLLSRKTSTTDTFNAYADTQSSKTVYDNNIRRDYFSLSSSINPELNKRFGTCSKPKQLLSLNSQNKLNASVSVGADHKCTVNTNIPEKGNPLNKDNDQNAKPRLDLNVTTDLTGIKEARCSALMPSDMNVEAMLKKQGQRKKHTIPAHPIWRNNVGSPCAVRHQKEFFQQSVDSVMYCNSPNCYQIQRPVEVKPFLPSEGYMLKDKQCKCCSSTLELKHHCNNCLAHSLDSLARDKTVNGNIRHCGGCSNFRTVMETRHAPTMSPSKDADSVVGTKLFSNRSYEVSHGKSCCFENTCFPSLSSSCSAGSTYSAASTAASSCLVQKNAVGVAKVNDLLEKKQCVEEHWQLLDANGTVKPVGGVDAVSLRQAKGRGCLYPHRTNNFIPGAQELIVQPNSTPKNSIFLVTDTRTDLLSEKNGEGTCCPMKDSVSQSASGVNWLLWLRSSFDCWGSEAPDARRHWIQVAMWFTLGLVVSATLVAIVSVSLSQRNAIKSESPTVSYDELLDLSVLTDDFSSSYFLNPHTSP